MARNVLFLLLCATTVERCFALKCYASKFDPKTISPEVEMVDCNVYLNRIRRMQGRQEGETTNLNCFTTTLTKGEDKKMIKGCFPKNGCKKLWPVFKNLSSGGEVQCRECDKDGCNSELDNVSGCTIVKKTNLYVFFFIIFLLFYLD